MYTRLFAPGRGPSPLRFPSLPERTNTSTMARLVMKFGGTSVADIDRIRNVARHVKREVDAGHEVAVVVSAMAGKTNELVAWCREAAPLARRPRIRRRGRLRRAGDRGAACDRAGRHRRQRALLAGLAAADHDLGRARLGAHPRRQRRRADQALQGARRGRGDRRLPGRAPGDRPHHHARPRRLRHLGGRDRRRDRRRALRHLHRRRRRLHHRSARGAEGAAARQDRLRGNAGTGLARRQGAAGALGRARHGAQRAHLRALEFRQARGHRSARGAAGHAHLRRGGDRGTAGRHRHRLLQGRGADLDPPGRRQARHRGRDLRAAGGGQHQRRHDRAERLRRRR